MPHKSALFTKNIPQFHYFCELRAPSPIQLVLLPLKHPESATALTDLKHYCIQLLPVWHGSSLPPTLRLSDYVQ